MVAWSAIGLRNLAKASLSKTLVPGTKNGLNGANYVPIRFGGGHHETIIIRTTRHEYTKFKDLMNFYLLIGCIPLGLIIAYTNIFIGPAKLAPIPEGYEPKHWEYYPHPITRFLAKYIVPSQQEHYERYMHTVFVTKEKADLWGLESDIQKRMKDKQDYQSWYFEKPEVKYLRKTHQMAAESDRDDVGKGRGFIY